MPDPHAGSAYRMPGAGSAHMEKGLYLRVRLSLCPPVYYEPDTITTTRVLYGRWSSFRASTGFRVYAAYLTISRPI